MSLSIGLDLPDFENALMNCIRNEFNRVIILACPAIKEEIKPIVKEAIEITPEYDSLVTSGGTLRKHLGLVSPKADMEKIIEEIQNNIEVKPIRVVRRAVGITGGLTVGILRTGYGDILGLPSAQYDSNGHLIEWLNWLLTKGDGVIISKYHFRNAGGRGLKGSRAGGLMFKGGTWKMSPQYSGTQKDNFLTRAFEDKFVQQAIANVIEKEITSRLT
jgi:hypothetical protein